MLTLPPESLLETRLRSDARQRLDGDDRALAGRIVASLNFSEAGPLPVRVQQPSRRAAWAAAAMLALAGAGVFFAMSGPPRSTRPSAAAAINQAMGMLPTALRSEGQVLETEPRAKLSLPGVLGLGAAMPRGAAGNS